MLEIGVSQCCRKWLPCCDVWAPFYVAFSYGPTCMMTHPWRCVHHSLGSPQGPVLMGFGLVSMTKQRSRTLPLRLCSSWSANSTVGFLSTHNPIWKTKNAGVWLQSSLACLLKNQHILIPRVLTHFGFAVLKDILSWLHWSSWSQWKLLQWLPLVLVSISEHRRSLDMGAI